MKTITDNYRDLNKNLHESNRNYGKSGKRYSDEVLTLAHEFRTFDILDYGCGKSTLQQQLPFKINQYDPAISKYSKEPESADIVVCTDVMEHIEPDCLGNVLIDIKNKARKVVYFSIATRPAVKFLADGRNAHLIVQQLPWWIKVLDDVGFYIRNLVNTPSGEFRAICLHKESVEEAIKKSKEGRQ